MILTGKCLFLNPWDPWDTNFIYYLLFTFTNKENKWLNPAEHWDILIYFNIWNSLFQSWGADCTHHIGFSTLDLKLFRQVSMISWSIQVQHKCKKYKHCHFQVHPLCKLQYLENLHIHLQCPKFQAGKKWQLHTSIQLIKKGESTHKGYTTTTWK